MFQDPWYQSLILFKTDQTAYKNGFCCDTLKNGF